MFNEAFNAFQHVLVVSVCSALDHFPNIIGKYTRIPFLARGLDCANRTSTSTQQQ